MTSVIHFLSIEGTTEADFKTTPNASDKDYIIENLLVGESIFLVNKMNPNMDSENPKNDEIITFKVELNAQGVV